MTKTEYIKLLQNYFNEANKVYLINTKNFDYENKYDALEADINNLIHENSEYQNKIKQQHNKIKKEHSKQIKKLEKKLKTISPDFFDKESKSNDEILEHAETTINNLSLIENTSIDDLKKRCNKPYKKEQILLSARIEIKHASLSAKFMSLIKKNRHYYNKKLVKDFVEDEKNKLLKETSPEPSQHRQSGEFKINNKSREQKPLRNGLSNIRSTHGLYNQERGRNS